VRLEVGEQLAHAGREPARELWARLWPLCHFLEGQSYSAAVKTACGLAGDATGPVRPPLLALDAAATRELGALLEHATSAHSLSHRNGH
jgi:dihydrodipicolinate synthase/N-acetylneuraminate lyase